MRLVSRIHYLQKPNRIRVWLLFFTALAIVFKLIFSEGISLNEVFLIKKDTVIIPPALLKN